MKPTSRAVVALTSEATTEAEPVYETSEISEVLEYVDEANRDIAKALAALEIRMQPVLRPPHAIPDDPSESDSGEAQCSPLRERLTALNSAQHQILRHFQELNERLGV